MEHYSAYKLMVSNESEKPKWKTMVLDLESTLVYSSSAVIPQYDYTISVRGHQEHSAPSTITYYVQKRPAIDLLIAELVRNMYEIIIFTSATKEYADAILDKLQMDIIHKANIDIRLYRDSCLLSNKDGYVKDITLLKRDLKNVIIVDDNPASYKLHPENAFPVKPFSGDLNDRELCRVRDLSIIAALSCDVRETIKIYLAIGDCHNLEYEFLRARQRELHAIAPQKKIIVLELMNTLVKRSKEFMKHDFTIPVRISGELCTTYVKKRPGLDNLLAELEQNYEIVVYTRYTREQADPILDKLDIGFHLNRRLYRDSCQDYWLCKDIGVLNKDLNMEYASVKNVVIVDCDASAFKHHPYNGFLVTPLEEGDSLDTELCKLKGFCKGAYLYDDVKEAIANFKRNGRRRISYFR